MQVTKISVNQNRNFIPIKGWSNVETILYAFANGKVSGSRATRDKLSEDIEESSGGMAAALLVISETLSEKDSFTERMLTEAKLAIEEHGGWRGDYDYDAMGTAFFKTGVSIVMLDAEEEIFGLSMSAAYVGNQGEINLANHFDISRAISRCTVEIEVAPASKTGFTFDFEPILRKLDSLLGIKALTGEEVAASMLKTGTFGSVEEFALSVVDGYEIKIAPGRVKDRMDYRNGNGPIDTWSVQGSLFSGELERDWEEADESAKAKPTLRIIISPEGADRFGHKDLIWKPEEQKKIITISEKIAGALRI